MLHQSVISIRGKDNTTCMRDTITFGYDEVGNLASMNRLTKATFSLPMISYDDPGVIDSLIFLDPIPGHPTLNFIPVTGGIGDLIQPIDIHATDRYTEQIWYDKNSNIEGLMRYGMNNQRQYGLIDSLVITRNGNQLKAVDVLP